MVRRSAFLDSSGEVDSSWLILTVEPEAARRVRADVVGAGGLATGVRAVRARAERRAGMMVCFRKYLLREQGASIYELRGDPLLVEFCTWIQQYYDKCL